MGQCAVHVLMEANVRPLPVTILLGTILLWDNFKRMLRVAGPRAGRGVVFVRSRAAAARPGNDATSQGGVLRRGQWCRECRAAWGLGPAKQKRVTRMVAGGVPHGAAHTVRAGQLSKSFTEASHAAW